MHGTVQGGSVSQKHFPADIRAREVWLWNLLMVVVRVVRVVVVSFRHPDEVVDAGRGRHELDGE